MADSINRLYDAVLAAREADPTTSRTARLLKAGVAKASKKMAEEAIEVVIDAMNGQTEAVVSESADLIYNLIVLWTVSGVRPEDVWAEMRRREQMMGIAEKLPKKQLEKQASKQTSKQAAPAQTAPSASAPVRRKVVALAARREGRRDR